MSEIPILTFARVDPDKVWLAIQVPGYAPFSMSRLRHSKQSRSGINTKE